MPDTAVAFDTIGRSAHPAFEGVALKHIVAFEKMDGQFSFHLVRIAPNKKIGSHIHKKQLETHEVIFCKPAGRCRPVFQTDLRSGRSTNTRNVTLQILSQNAMIIEKNMLRRMS